MCLEKQVSDTLMRLGDRAKAREARAESQTQLLSKLLEEEEIEASPTSFYLNLGQDFSLDIGDKNAKLHNG